MHEFMCGFLMKSNKARILKHFQSFAANLAFCTANELSLYLCFVFIEVQPVSGLWIQALLFYYAFIYIWATLSLNYVFVLFLFHYISVGMLFLPWNFQIFIIPFSQNHEFQNRNKLAPSRIHFSKFWCLEFSTYLLSQYSNICKIHQVFDLYIYD